MTPALTLDDVITTQVVSGVRWFYVRHPKRRKERQAFMSYEAAAELAKLWWGIA